MKARPDERRSAYEVLAEVLRDEIRQGTFDGQRQLPTEASLAADHGLSRQTVRRAYLELVAEGLVDRVPGRGTFVAQEAPKYLREFGSVEDLMGLALDTTVQIIEPLARRVNIEAAARLGLETDLVHSLTYLRSHQEIPFGWTTVSLTPAVAALVTDAAELVDLAARQPLTVLGLLEGRLETPIVEAQQSISAVAADERTVSLLGCEPGVPLLRIDRLFVSAVGEPLELSVGFFLPDQYTYRTVLRRTAGKTDKKAGVHRRNRSARSGDRR